MSQYHLWDALRTAGVIIDLRENQLFARPAKAITPQVADFIRANKPELVAMLQRSSDLPTCDICRGLQIAVRTFDNYENQECLSCGVCNGTRATAFQRKPTGGAVFLNSDLGHDTTGRLRVFPQNQSLKP